MSQNGHEREQALPAASSESLRCGLRCRIVCGSLGVAGAQAAIVWAGQALGWPGWLWASLLMLALAVAAAAALAAVARAAPPTPAAAHRAPTGVASDPLALLATLAHDLRTPLTRLRLRVETRCAPAEAAELEEDLQALTRIVEQCMACLELDRGALPGVPAPVHETVADVLRRFRRAGHAIEADIEPVAAALLPDTSVDRLVSNLLDNALRHGAAPVRLHLQALPGGGFELQVSDAGPGLEAEAFERASQRGLQAHEGASHGHRSSHGLGLAIAARIAHRIGGAMRLQPPAHTGSGSGSGSGARVSISVRCGAHEAHAPQREKFTLP